MMVLRGQSAHFKVFYDDALSNGPMLADIVLAGCEMDLSRLSALFGGIMPASLPFVINIQPEAPPDFVGAMHGTCLDTTIYCYRPVEETDGVGVLSLVDVEVAEVLMATQNHGFYCDQSNGEALSRVLGAVLYPQRAWAFSTSNDWLNGGRPDFVNINDPTDRSSISIGCGALFLNYLAHQLNFTWAQIIAAAGPTLAQTAANLGVPSAPDDFFSLIGLHFSNTVWWKLADDNPFPLFNEPHVYIRDTLTDDGASPSQPVGDSPDIIVKSNYLGQGVCTLYTAPSIYSDTESDDVLTGQNYCMYLRVWNRGPLTQDVEASVYWSPPVTLATPNLWTLIYTFHSLPVPLRQYLLAVTDGAWWFKNQIPGPGHYCFVATVGTAEKPAPDPATLTLGSFDDYVAYVAANNNIAWRNFNVVDSTQEGDSGFQGFVKLPFHITGAWDKERAFEFETIGTLPKGSDMILELPHHLALRFKPKPKKMDVHKQARAESRARITLPPHVSQHMGTIHLPAGTKAASHLLVRTPEKLTQRHELSIRQLYKGHEVGRITWIFGPVKRVVEPRLRPQHEAALGT